MGPFLVSQSLISRNEDLRRLREDGYDIEIRSSCLVLRDVPYVNGRREVNRGVLVSSLSLAGDVTQRPDPHTIRFGGELPCHADGSPMHQLVNESSVNRLDDSLETHHTFSQKPPCGYYQNYYDKMTTYERILSSQARAIDPSVMAQTYKVEEPDDERSPFRYLDTASGRAEITIVSQKLALPRIAIIGLGGTGAYVLDLVAKTPVGEIHVFDGDKMSTHNAFRSPGAASLDELRAQPLKTDYFSGKYGQMRKGIVPHGYYLDQSNVAELQGMAFVFLCIDRGPAKAPIVAALEGYKIPFIDVGMGIYVKTDSLGGTMTVTASTAGKRDHFRQRVSFADRGEDAYDTNIQIADLNALNATLAVVRWKKMYGFYLDLEKEHFGAYTIESNSLIGEDCP